MNMTIQKRGIDISEWQPNFPYALIAPQIDFVILREGYRQKIDAQFKNHVKGFKDVGVPIIGVYHFIYALTEEDAKKEAISCIQNVEKVGLPKDIRIWADFEYDTVTNAARYGVTLGSKECNLFTRIFCDTIKEAGYNIGIYTNVDYYTHWYTNDTIISYPIWLADYTGNPDFNCIIHQWGTKVYNGYNQALDSNYLYDIHELQRSDSMTEAQAIDKVINLAKSEVGYMEKKSPISLYDKTANAGTGNYTKYGKEMHDIQPGNMDYPAPWCDAFIDWLFKECFGVKLAKAMLCGDFDDYTYSSITLYQKAGRWFGTGKRGDQIFFGGSGHTGIVTQIVNGRVYTIEGNKSNMVRSCIYYTSDSSILGYGRPKYELVVSDDTSIKDDWKPIGTATCTGDEVNVRETPGGQIISKLNKGNRFEVDGQRFGDWIHIKRTDLDKIGWIHKDYVRPD